MLVTEESAQGLVSRPARPNVFVCFPTPVRFVARREGDNIDLTDNEDKFRYVKLNRLSATVVYRPDEKQVFNVGLDGSFLTPIGMVATSLEQAATEFNNLFGTLCLGGLRYDAVRPADLGVGLLYDNGYCRVFPSMGGEYRIRQALRSNIAGAYFEIAMHNPRSVISSQIIEAFRTGEKALKSAPNVTAASICRALGAHFAHDWTESLLQMWIVAEQVVEQYWKTKIVSAEKKEATEIRIDGRSDSLADSRTWTASSKTELLRQIGELSPETHSQLSIARRARNKLVHEGTAPRRANAEACIAAVYNLLSGLVQTDTATQLQRAKAQHSSPTPLDEAGKPRPFKQPSADDDSHYFGPFPPIPGEAEWGDRPYENIFEEDEMKARPAPEAYP